MTAVIAILAMAGQNHATGWVAKFLNSSEAAAARNRVANLRLPTATAFATVSTLVPVKSGAAVSARQFGMHPIPISGAQALAMRVAREEEDAAARLVVQGKRKEAYQLILAFVQSHVPDYGTKDQLVSLALISGHYKEAEEVLVQEISSPGRTMQPNQALFTSLSLALAAQGHVYPGQAESMDQALRVTNQFAIAYSPESRTANCVASESCLCLVSQAPGPQTHFPLLELALDFDSRNTPAAYAVARICSRIGQFSEAARAGGLALRGMTAGDQRNSLEQSIKEWRAEPDDKGLYLEKYDRGHEARMRRRRPFSSPP